MTVANFTETWIALSKKIIASVLVDDGAVFVVHNIIGQKSRWFAPKERPIWDAVIQCLESNTPPTVEAVNVRVNGHTPAGYVKTLAGTFNDDDNRHLEYNANQLKEIGILSELREFGRELARIDALEDINTTVDKVVTQAGGILAMASTRSSNAVSVSDVAWQQIQTHNEIGIETGLKWFDNLTGGLWRGMNYWVVAPYKSGKSTIMRNCVLRAATLNSPVGVFCAEGSREMFALDCQTMLATQLLYDNGLRGKDLRLSSIFIKHYWQQAVLSKIELDALHDARDIWNGLPIHVWDTKDGIRNLATLRYLVKRGRVHHGIKSVWADYSQLFGEGGTIYERQSQTALAVQDIAQTENVAFCMLAQKNEEGVRSDAGYSANVKGGGDAAAAADFLLIPKIDQEIPGTMIIQLKFSRHTRTGQGDHIIVPASGLIIQ